MSLDDQLAEIAAHAPTKSTDALEAATRALIDQLAARHGISFREAQVEDATTPADEHEFDAQFELVYPGESAVETSYWAASFSLLPVMSQDRHVTCALEIEAGVIAQGVLDGEWDIATDASEDDLRRIAQWGQRSLEEMVIGNLKLAIHWAKHYARRDQELAQDLFQEAYKGLVRAIQGWDALRGYKFSTYATWHIRQSIQRAFNGGAERTPVHIPVHVNDQIRKARREGTDLSDLAQVALKWREQTVSWERLEESYADLVSLVEPDPIEGFLERTTIVDAAAQCLAYLDEREAHILAARYGIRTGETETLDAIGKDLGVTRERIRQLETRALTSLRIHTASLGTFRTPVLRHIRRHEPALLVPTAIALASDATDTRSIAREAGVPLTIAKHVASAICKALAAVAPDVHDLPRIWIQPRPTSKISQWLQPYEPRLSLNLSQ